MRRALICLLLLAGSHAAHAMRFSVEGALVSAFGKVEVGDTDRLTQVLRALPPGTGLAGLALDSPGGQLDEGERLAAVVHRLQLPTVVVSGAKCASACFVVFAAGQQRFASTAALLGVHSATSADGDTPDARAATVQMARRLAEYGVPYAVLGKMIATAPSRVWWLDRADLLSMQVELDRLPEATVPIREPLFQSASTDTKPGDRPHPAGRGFKVEPPASGYRIWRPDASD